MKRILTNDKNFAVTRTLCLDLFFLNTLPQVFWEALEYNAFLPCIFFKVSGIPHHFFHNFTKYPTAAVKATSFVLPHLTESASPESSDCELLPLKTQQLR